MEPTPARDIVTVGASMGGIDALSRFAAGLPKDLPASVFVVQHTAPGAPGVLARVLGRHCALPVQFAENGMTIEHGRVYVAPPDYHLLVLDHRVGILRGPRENRWRPAIDPTFRSAAVAYSSRVTGVVLTGYLDDGTAGLSAIKRCGGTAIVQDPLDAAYGEMPESALARVDVDYVLPLDEIPSTLARLAREPAGPPPPIPDDIRQEVQFLMESATTKEMAEASSTKTSLVCPECGGVLYEVHSDDIQRFRCHVGHAYTATSLLEDQKESLERALWAALRSLEDRAVLLEKMAREAKDRGFESIAAGFTTRAEEAKTHSMTLRELLTRQK